jgi:Putative zinc-finger
MNGFCPDEEKLADFLEGRLSREDRSQTEEHLAGCQGCLEALVIANTLTRGTSEMELEPVPAAVTETAVGRVMNRYAATSGSLTQGIRPSLKDLGARMIEVLSSRLFGESCPAPVRSSKIVSSEDRVCVRVPFKEIDTEIEIEKAGVGTATIRVRLLETSTFVRALRATLKQGEREITSHLVEGSSVLFEDIPFGHYGVSLTEDGKILGTYLFEIKESHGGRR